MLVASRLPRLLAAVIVGVALGVAGAALQSLARNPLASPDTLAVNAGAYLAVVGRRGVRRPASRAAGRGVAFLGGLAAAGLVLVLSAGGAAGPTRLVLAGTAVALALGSLTTVLLLLFEQETIGLFALGQRLARAGRHARRRPDSRRSSRSAVAGLVLLARRLDILALGDDTARVLGVHVRRTRLGAVLLAVLLSAAAVTVAGPIGFVGLCAPVIVRLLARRRSPASSGTGAAAAVGHRRRRRACSAPTCCCAPSWADRRGVDIPAGVVTTLFGAVVLVVAGARGYRDTGPTRQPPTARPVAACVPARSSSPSSAAAVAAVAAVVLGHARRRHVAAARRRRQLARRATGPAYTFVLDQR